ncbi:MAG: hypothetical protein SX243_00940 [Acidobacteriota bacterium]|nr:hypothetical protein [Acidobacteriota bacterium]
MTPKLGQAFLIDVEIYLALMVQGFLQVLSAHNFCQGSPQSLSFAGGLKSLLGFSK